MVESNCGMERQSKLNLINNYNRRDIVIVKGEKNYLVDCNNNKYLDLISGLGVNILGYSNRQLIRAINTQSKKLLNCSNLFYEKNQLDYADLLVKQSIFEKVFFCNSVSEGIDSAIKVARKYSHEKYGDNKRIEIVTMKGGFYGRTFGAFSASDSRKEHILFGPTLPGFKFCKFNDLADFKDKVSSRTCAVILELVQGHAGTICGSKKFIRCVQRIALEKDLILIIDEAQTAFGRLGRLFGYELYKIKPDIIVLGKPAGGGLPLGVVLFGRKTKDILAPGEHGSTFGGNALSCAAGLAMMKIITKNRFIRGVEKKGVYFKNRLNYLKDKHSCIKEVRGVGLMLALVLDMNARNLTLKLAEEGVIVDNIGDTIVRFLPPLTLTKIQVDYAIKMIDMQIIRLGGK